MNTNTLDRILRETLEDQRLSRGEGQALLQWLEDEGGGAKGSAQFRSRAFHIARSTLKDAESLAMIDWLEGVMKIAARPNSVAKTGSLAEARFSPGQGCLQMILQLLGAARRTIDICVFTVTDNRITSAIEAAHRRGVKVRLITDNEKAWDKGSDVFRLDKAGIAMRVDKTRHHMHHKYAIFDNTKLLTGSYNWTRSAESSNEENIIVTDNPALLKAFVVEFDALWQKFA